MAQHGAALHRILARDGEDGVLIVVSLPPERIAEEQDRLAVRFDVPVSVIDQATHEAMLRLAGAGFVAMPTEGLREVFPGPEAQTGNVADRRRMRADALVQRARRKFKAATLLEGGGFAEEALAPAVEAARFATGAIAALRGLGEPDDAESAAAFLARTEPDNGFENLPHGVIGILSGDHGDDGIAPVGSLIDQVDDALRQD
ncbi:MAG: hypothetical protein OXQ90_03735 [Gammaproteobacteria bacterium]|nr:hypothetical protein [Gammaproteobacteria bacterium]